MSMNVFQNIKDAIAHLNPHEIRDQVNRPVRLVLYADSESAYQQMENFFVPAELSDGKRAELANVVFRASSTPSARTPATGLEIQIFSRGLPKDKEGFTFHPENPEHTVKDILKRYPDVGVALARSIYPFRAPVADQIVKKIAKENALFSLATALPDMIPFLTLPWAVGEFASDTAFLTANQVRMAFLLAAISDRDIGYREQKGELVSILLGAFGWRAIARELVGKIPFGGGLVPKAAVAYAGTKVVGMSIERYYRIGYGYTRQERRVVYEDALERGKTIAGGMLNALKHRHVGQAVRLP
jgi:uncharacterized protein (DUF697 family)